MAVELIETYAPVHLQTGDDVAGVAEFYQPTMSSRARPAPRSVEAGFVVAATMFVMYVVLFGLVRRGSQDDRATARRAQRARIELSTLSHAMHASTHAYAARRRARLRRTSSFLRRISSDLHDGPGQDLGFAQMRLTTLADRVRSSPIDLVAPDCCRTSSMRFAQDSNRP